MVGVLMKSLILFEVGPRDTMTITPLICHRLVLRIICFSVLNEYLFLSVFELNVYFSWRLSTVLTLDLLLPGATWPLPATIDFPLGSFTWPYCNTIKPSMSLLKSPYYFITLSFHYRQPIQWIDKELTRVMGSKKYLWGSCS